MSVERVEVGAFYRRGRSGRVLVPRGADGVEVLYVRRGTLRHRERLTWREAVRYEAWLLQTGWEEAGGNSGGSV